MSAYDYEGKICFTTDKQLTAEQIGQLIAVLVAQIEEPADEYGDDEEYNGRNVEIEIREVE